MQSTANFIMLCKVVGHGIQAEARSMACREWKGLIFVLNSVWLIFSVICAVEEVFAVPDRISVMSR